MYEQNHQQEAPPELDNSERQANYLILRSLEGKVPQDLFQQILDQSRATMQLPRRTGWDGNQFEVPYQDLKVQDRATDTKCIPQLLTGQKRAVKGDSEKEASGLTGHIKRQLDPTRRLKRNIFTQLHPHQGKFQLPLRKETRLRDLANFERMKTVFCHADMTTDEVSSIFNVQFDQTGRFIVSGADDGIIKVWDQQTMQLQASLHGHSDYITDLDVSKCNQYIASASKDATIIIWDIKLGKKIKTFTNHQALINRVQFFSPKTKTTENETHPQLLPNQKNLSGPASIPVQQQFLISCSDDGTVNVFNFSPLSANLAGAKSSQNSRSEVDELRVRRSSRNQNSGHHQSAEGDEVDIFNIMLTPDDFRPGQRNKKLDCLSMNNNGVVCAGSNTGELFVWKLNLQAIQQRSSAEQCSKYMGQFKISKNLSGVQYCEFSPKSDLMMTGSTDGRVKIYKMDQLRKTGDPRPFSLNDQSRLVVTIDEQKGCEKVITSIDPDREGIAAYSYRTVPVPVDGGLKLQKNLAFNKHQCDAVKWSANGRYAIASLTSQVQGTFGPADQTEEVCRIKIYDTLSETFYDDLARPSGFSLKKNTWVLAPHPVQEEILMTGSDGGILMLWNIHTKQLLQQFSQYGVYSIDSFCMDNPLDGRFSPDGKSFIVGQQLGTISLFSNEGKHHRYESTRVQQFFPYDQFKQPPNNPFEAVTEQPHICGYNMVEYEVQPKPLIGRFVEEQKWDSKHRDNELVREETQQDLIKRHEAFERKLVLAKELGKTEEQYYLDQLNSCQRQELFQPQIFEQGRQRLESLVLSDIEYQNPAQDADQAENVFNRALVNALSPDPVRTQPRTGAQRSQPNTSQEQAANNGRRSRLRRNDSTVNRRVRQAPLNMANFSSEDGDEVHNRSESEDFQSVESGHSSSEMSDESGRSFTETRFELRGRTNVHERQEQRRPGRPSRAQRAARRNDPSSNSSNQQNGPSGRSLRLRARQQNMYRDEPSDIDMESPDRNRDGRRTSRRQRISPEQPEPMRRLRRNRDQDEEMVAETALSRGTRSRPRRTLNERSQSPPAATSGRRSRRQAVITTSDGDTDEVVNFDQSPAKDFGNHFEMSDREIQDDEEDQTYEKEQMGFQQSTKDVDHDFEFIQDRSKVLSMMSDKPFEQVCGFCKRFDQPIIGPFCQFENKSRDKLVGQPLFFHKECIEKNNFSFFNVVEKKWVNIGTALKKLVYEKKFICARCKTDGATISCTSCANSFHGFKCAELCMVLLGGADYQCYFCRNKVNYNDAQALQSQTKGISDEHKETCKRLSREHLLEIRTPAQLEMQENKVRGYQPQLNDLVYYFFQGHEQYMSENSCHFYCGQQENFPKRQMMPWLKDSDIRNKALVLCKVLSIKTMFPSRRSCALIKAYSENDPQIIQIVTLAIVSTDGTQCRGQKEFTVQLFPTRSNDFLVLQAIFEDKWQSFSKMQGELEGKDVKILTKQNGLEKVKIIKLADAIEPSYYGNSFWQNIVCINVAAQSGGRSVQQMPGHRSTRRQVARISSDVDQGAEHRRISFWDIQFVNSPKHFYDLDARKSFSAEEQLRLLQRLEEEIHRKKDYFLEFVDRVTEQIAPDYRSWIPQDMYFNLIKARLTSGFYRCSDQLFSDLDLIPYNASSYNGQEHDVTATAVKLCETVRMKFKPLINNQPAKLVQQNILDAGKLTAPTRTRSKDEIEQVYQQLAKEQPENQLGLTTIDTRVRIPRGAQPVEETKEDRHQDSEEEEFFTPAQSRASRRQNREQQRNGGSTSNTKIMISLDTSRTSDVNLGRKRNRNEVPVEDLERKVRGQSSEGQENGAPQSRTRSGRRRIGRILE